MDSFFYTDIPTWQDGIWKTTTFNTQEEFSEFLVPLFKEPGKYQFDETSFLFTAEARKYRKDLFFCDAPDGSKDYTDYWDIQANRCRKGVFFIHGDKTWYIPREYYMWLNFLPINDKEQKKFDFPQFRDAQYHIALYEILAELNYQHVAIVKKRQIASSYYHCGRFINKIWFEETPILKLGAAEKRFVNEEGDWKFLEEYRHFLNEHTAWYRPMNPGKVGIWQQQVEITKNYRKTMEGFKGVIQALTFDKSPEKGISGPCHRKGTLILMATGEFKKIETISVGDFILGTDNHPKKVLKKFSGFDEIYKIEQTRGNDYYTTGDHLLYLINRDTNVTGNKLRLTKTKDWNDFPPNRKKFFVGVKSYWPLEFTNSFCFPTLDPYFLGLWLGDGHRSKLGLIINYSKDPEILDYLKTLSVKYETPYTLVRKDANRYNDEMYNFMFSTSHSRGKDTYILKQFVKYNLFYNKHIPPEFLFGSVDVRREVLAGIIDTDGNYDSVKGRFAITSMNKEFADQIAFLCRSLGAYVRQGRAASATHQLQGKTVKYTETNTVSAYFENPSFIPTKVLRKIGRSKRNNRSVHTAPIYAVTNVGVEEYSGIEVEGNLYFLDDLTIAHNCTEFFYDEGGNAATADISYRYLRPAMRSGMITTGLFIIAGSVGELDKAEPLRKFVTYPRANGFRAIKTDLIDDMGTIGETALFIPEQWSMPPYIDQYGNSLVPEALEALNKELAEMKKDLTVEEYQLEVSQRPRNLKEAFAVRTDSKFPMNLVLAQKRRIEDKEYPTEYLNIIKNEKSELIFVPATKPPVTIFPLPKNSLEKEGCIVVYERPIGKQELGKTCVASIDPIKEGVTTTSFSLFSIMIYRLDTEVIKYGEEVESWVESGKLVAEWTGRFDDINKTHERAMFMLEMYQARAIVEANVAEFITFMISKKRQHYLVPKSQMLFLKELGANESAYQEYGWKNTGKLFDSHLIRYGIEFLKEEIDYKLINVKDKEDQKKILVRYGIERLPSLMLMKEMEAYQPGMNVDRLITFCSLAAYVKIYLANFGYAKRTIEPEKRKVDKTQYAKPTSFFRSIGTPQSTNPLLNVKKSPFRNLK